MKFTSFLQFQAYLDSLGLFSMHLGLERMEAALARLELTRPKGFVVHVVGTNGKGSTSGFLASLAGAHDIKAGVYSSPHLVNVRERMCIDGRQLPEQEWIEAANRVLGRCEDVGLTYFELLTVMAVLMFERHEVDLLVLEAGLGGTHDATRAVDADLTVITPIGMDHENVLGSTLEKIASDKAGALGRCPAVIGIQDKTVLPVLEGATGAFPLKYLHQRRGGDGYNFREYGLFLLPGHLPYHPPYQTANAALALLAWTEVVASRGWSFDAGLCTQALATTRFSGRFSRYGRFLVDGAHNTSGIMALCEGIERRGTHFDTLVFQAMQDKVFDPRALRRLQKLVNRVIIPGMPGLPRACRPKDLAAVFEPPAETALNLAEAVRQPGAVLVCGSLYLVGEFYGLYPDYFGM